MKAKTSLKIRVARICSCVILLSCAACSREKDDVYQDPWADSDGKIGVQTSKQIESADQHGGRYSVHEYFFKGKGPAHKMSEVRKYGLDHMGSRGSDVCVKVHIEWPEEQSGLSKDALAKVRKTILWIAFAHTPEVKPYSAPESLGETEESLRKHDKELWARKETRGRLTMNLSYSPLIEPSWLAMRFHVKQGDSRPPIMGTLPPQRLNLRWLE